MVGDLIQMVLVNIGVFDLSREMPWTNPTCHQSLIFFYINSPRCGLELRADVFPHKDLTAISNQRTCRSGIFTSM